MPPSLGRIFLEGDKTMRLLLASERPPGRVLGCHRKAEEWGLVSGLRWIEELQNGAGLCDHPVLPGCWD